MTAFLQLSGSRSVRRLSPKTHNTSSPTTSKEVLYKSNKCHQSRESSLLLRRKPSLQFCIVHLRDLGEAFIKRELLLWFLLELCFVQFPGEVLASLRWLLQQMTGIHCSRPKTKREGASNTTMLSEMRANQRSIRSDINNKSKFIHTDTKD